MALNNFKDIAGRRYGRLFVIGLADGVSKGGEKLWRVICDCGKTQIRSAWNMKSGATTSCGCTVRKHGLSKTPIYKLWYGIIQRCKPHKKPWSKNYGDRGIRVIDRWLKFENFLKDMGEKPKGKSLDRIDNNKGYLMENCRWASPMEQMNNTRANHYLVLKGKRLTMAQWARVSGVKYKTLCERVRLGFGDNDLLSLTKIRR